MFFRSAVFHFFWIWWKDLWVLVVCIKAAQIQFVISSNHNLVRFSNNSMVHDQNTNTIMIYYDMIEGFFLIENNWKNVLLKLNLETSFANPASIT